jgi:hypothetical protein
VSCCVALQGDTRPGWPIQMGEVQGQVMVTDLNEDGAVEIFAGGEAARAGAAVTFNRWRTGRPMRLLAKQQTR